MYAKKWRETKYEERFGNKYNILLPKNRTLTKSLELALVRVKKGAKVPKHTHAEEEQAYLILEGRGILRIKRERKEVGKGMVVYIPMGAEHEIEGVSGKDLTYVYVASWPSLPAKGKS